jgi:hypothetical protein
MKTKEVMKAKDLSLYLSLPESRIKTLVKRNEIPYIKFSNKILFQKKVIDQWLTNNRTINSPGLSEFGFNFVSNEEE